jgi:hypothetical protein
VEEKGRFKDDPGKIVFHETERQDLFRLMCLKQYRLIEGGQYGCEV